METITDASGRRHGGLARRFADDRRGNMLVMSALALPAIIGMAGLATEYGAAVAARADSQRVADLASYAGAVAYAREQSSSRMRAAARTIAEMNGVDPSAVTVEIVPSPADSGEEAVRVTVDASRPAMLSTLVSDRLVIPVRATASVQVGGAAEEGGGCMLALDPSQSGITLSGGTKITAPECTVASNASFSLSGSGTIEAQAVTYGTSAPAISGGASIRGPGGGAPDISKRHTPDPLEGNAAIADAWSRMSAVASMPAPGGNGGNPIDFGWNQSSTQAQAQAAGCSASFASGTWTLDCSGRQEVRFGPVTVGGGINVDFDLGSAGRAFTLASVTTAGRVRFGSGSFTIQRGLNVSNGTTTFGSGGTSSYRIGPNASGTAISVAGGAGLAMEDATGPGSVFQVKGNVTSGGGSCVEMGAAAHHDIDGYMSFQGGAALGAGTWTVNGYVALGANSGGSVNCSGRSLSLDARDVTLVLSGRNAPNTWACQRTAFCAGGGYGNMQLVAPDSGPTARIAVIGPQGGQGLSSGFTLAAGASNARVSGAVYFPGAAVTMSGGSGLQGGPGDCLQVIASRIELTGGTAAASNCLGEIGGGKAASAPRLVR